MTGHSHELPSQQKLEHRLKEVERDLARAEKSDPERIHTLKAEIKKIQHKM
ncbi:hypothetical protein [Gluconobacter oxydans]|uniref:DUF465 domain-containing protein n=1 Tax=Gluconobacter oxydans TaxID=442 RepID=A0AB35AP49_GLUOY|nr:hypothetical protein [Gluconobacter oxydans]MBF0856077.1 hypothetical protein [Gluconobacter oxydans]TCW27346.1 hypothetical protein EDC20_10794 [Gluconobacter oxydans]GEC60439.1 hypothetical protein GOX01_07700 [Gluconobacter oxydans]